MLGRITRLLGITPPSPQERELLRLAHGDTVPEDGTAGYMTGCLFQHSDGGDGTALYVNEGDEDACDFNAVTVA